MSARPWTHFYGGDIAAEVDADAYPSLVHLMDAAIDRYRDRTALRSAGNALTYADVDRLSRAFAAFLQSQIGIEKGDRVAVMMPNLLAFPIALLGILRAGAVAVTVNPLYTPRELQQQLDDSGAATIVLFNGSTPILAEVIGKTGVKTIVTAAVGDGGSNAVPSPPVDPRLETTTSFATALAQGATLPFTPVDLNGDDLALLQYTGGTTGQAKGAALAHRGLVANTEQFKAMIPLMDGEEVAVTALPLYHVMGLLVCFVTGFSVGAENWLVANPRDMDRFVETLKQARPTLFMGVNTMFAGLAAHPRIGEVDWTRLRLSGGGGAAVNRATSERWQQVTGTFIREGYGLSETGTVVSVNPKSIGEFTGTTGVPLPSTDVKVIDDDDREVAQGVAGEICVKGPQVMRGYWNKPEANAAAFTRDGYFRTGDIGLFDPRGLLKIVDRKKDMVLVSGFNVYPNEVEEVVSGLEGVAECACVGVPDDKCGEAVKLFVVRSPGAALTSESVVAHCRKELASYKVPRIVQFIDALPKTPVGKVLRRELRDRVP